MMCELFGVLSATDWCVCIVRCVECDCMVCELFGVLSTSVWCVYCSVC